MLDVLVTCHPHSQDINAFPQVRGHYLAAHLARQGLRASFELLPIRRTKCRVVIVSEYQQRMRWFERHLEKPLSRIRAERHFCMTEVSLFENEPHDFSREYCEWFAARGGVLCHVAPKGLEPYETCIGVGVDTEVVRAAENAARTDIVFDFPTSPTVDAAASFDPLAVDAVRARSPHLRLVGTGIASDSIRALFDEWVPYGQPHPVYVQALLPRAVAIVPGCKESLGLTLAEAQVAGACVVSAPGQVLPEMRIPEADVPYETGDPASLAAAVDRATTRDPVAIRTQAIERFDYAAVARRTRAAIGL